MYRLCKLYQYFTRVSQFFKKSSSCAIMGVLSFKLIPQYPCKPPTIYSKQYNGDILKAVFHYDKANLSISVFIVILSNLNCFFNGFLGNILKKISSWDACFGLAYFVF